MSALPPKADVRRNIGPRMSKFEYGFKKLFDGHFSRFGCGGVVTDMRIKLDARVFIIKWLPRRSINQQARGLFADDALANRLTIGNHGGRCRTEWIVKSVRGRCILGDLNVVSSCL